MSYFKAKMHQIRFRLGLAPDPAGGSNSAPPDPLAALRGPTSKGEGGDGGEEEEGKGGEGEGGEGGEEGDGKKRGREGRGRGRKGEGRELPRAPRMLGPALQVGIFVMRAQRIFFESPGERILKIGPHLPKLLSNIKWLTFLEHGAAYNKYTGWAKKTAHRTHGNNFVNS